MQADLADAVAETQARLDEFAPEGLWFEVWFTHPPAPRLVGGSPCGRVFCTWAARTSGDSPKVFELQFPRITAPVPRTAGGPSRMERPWPCLWDGQDFVREDIGVFSFQPVFQDGRPIPMIVRLWPGGDGLLRRVPDGAREFVTEQYGPRFLKGTGGMTEAVVIDRVLAAWPSDGLPHPWETAAPPVPGISYLMRLGRLFQAEFTAAGMEHAQAGMAGVRLAKKLFFRVTPEQDVLRAQQDPRLLREAVVKYRRLLR